MVRKVMGIVGRAVAGVVGLGAAGGLGDRDRGGSSATPGAGAALVALLAGGREAAADDGAAPAGGGLPAGGRGWRPYQAEQYFTTDPPGFLWKASFRMAPLVSVIGRDQYRHGEASLQMRVLSLVPVASKTGGGLDQGDLLRYLGELQWFPAGALADYITWEPLAGDAARATMSYGETTASMTFHFGTEGRLLEARAIRYNDARGRNESWVNRNDADAEFGGLRVPVVGEARWGYDSGPSPYIRWRVTDVERDQPARY